MQRSYLTFVKYIYEVELAMVLTNLNVKILDTNYVATTTSIELMSHSNKYMYK